MKQQREEPVTPLDLLSAANYTTRDIRDARFAVCKECDRFQGGLLCGECHCFMAAKTWLSAAACPLDRWSA
jgi:Family of unknown function (DUF6171)